MSDDLTVLVLKPLDWMLKRDVGQYLIRTVKNSDERKHFKLNIATDIFD